MLILKKTVTPKDLLDVGFVEIGYGLFQLEYYNDVFEKCLISVTHTNRVLVIEINTKKKSKIGSTAIHPVILKLFEKGLITTIEAEKTQGEEFEVESTNVSDYKSEDNVSDYKSEDNVSDYKSEDNVEETKENEEHTTEVPSSEFSIGSSRMDHFLNLVNDIAKYVKPENGIRKELLDGKEYYVDDNNNKWSAYNTTLEQAIKNSKTLVDCRSCTDCKECTDCLNCTNCNNCTDCIGCQNCSNCTDCSSCIHCNNCTDCAVCKDCTNCVECEACTNCTNCVDCFRCDRYTNALDIKNATVNHEPNESFLKMPVLTKFQTKGKLKTSNTSVSTTNGKSVIKINGKTYTANGGNVVVSGNKISVDGVDITKK